MKTIHVNWYGPFTLDEVDEAAEQVSKEERRDKSSLHGYGLYAWTGRKIGQHTAVGAGLHYIGITEDRYTNRFSDENHKYRKLVRSEKKIWLGKIQGQEVVTRSDLEAAESIFVSYLHPSLNATKLNLPKFSCTVISKFCKKDMEPYQRIPSIISIIPELVIWDGKNIRDNRTRIREYTP